MGKHVDLVYKELVEKILSEGVKREDRTGTGTISSFGNQIEIDLQDGFPLLTTKRVYWNGVKVETVAFLKGITDLKYFLDHKVDIWTRDAYKKFLREHPEYSGEYTLDMFRDDASQLGYDLGGIYGYNWVNFNGQGINQLDDLDKEYKSNPHSRRLKVYTANPAMVHEQTLPPCHDAFQFYVRDGYLDCLFSMRSNDVALGNPFNIASYALITHIQAERWGLKVGKLIGQLGDTHIYLNHIEPLQEQIKREPLELPTLKLSERVKNLKSISDIELDDIELIGYNPHPTIKMKQSF